MFLQFNKNLPHKHQTSGIEMIGDKGATVFDEMQLDRRHPAIHCKYNNNCVITWWTLQFNNLFSLILILIIDWNNFQTKVTEKIVKAKLWIYAFMANGLGIGEY